MQGLRAVLEKTDNSYWADRTEEQMLAVSGWIALAEGNKEQAEKLMRAAATWKTAVSNTSRWKTGSIRCASFTPNYCLKSVRPRPRCANLKRRCYRIQSLPQHLWHCARGGSIWRSQ
jgi:hypothetical protein